MAAVTPAAVAAIDWHVEALSASRRAYSFGIQRPVADARSPGNELDNDFGAERAADPCPTSNGLAKMLVPSVLWSTYVLIWT